MQAATGPLPQAPTPGLKGRPLVVLLVALTSTKGAFGGRPGPQPSSLQAEVSWSGPWLMAGINQGSICGVSRYWAPVKCPVPCA